LPLPLLPPGAAPPPREPLEPPLDAPPPLSPPPPLGVVVVPGLALVGAGVVVVEVVGVVVVWVLVELVVAVVVVGVVVVRVLVELVVGVLPAARWQSCAASWLTVEAPWVRFWRRFGLIVEGRLETSSAKLRLALCADAQSLAETAAETWSSLLLRLFA
jgi:hypothetical protein